MATPEAEIADASAPTEPATRAHVVHLALSYNGTDDGQGYDGPNPFSTDLGRPAEAWCADAVSDWFKRALLPLPPMQPGCRTGFAYVPDAVAYALAHKAGIGSWQALPADIATFDWNGDGLADHTELVTGYRDGTLYTIGGNSGPSNLDQYTGEGGVHRHSWPAPQGIGNPMVLLVINADALVAFGTQHPTNPGKHDGRHRLLMLKSPMMSGTDVVGVQRALDDRYGPRVTPDGVYGPRTRDAVMAWQKNSGIAADGIVGPQTRLTLGLPV